MMYFSGAEILYSVFASLFFGGVFGLFYRSLQEAVNFLRSVFYLFHTALINCADISINRIKKEIISKNSNKSEAILINVVDLLYFLAFGIIAVLITYSTLDGTPRLFIPFFMCASFIVINITAGDLASIVIGYIFRTVNAAFLLLLEMILHYPVITLLRLRKIINTNIYSIKIRRLRKVSHKLIEKKINDIKRLKG